MIQITDGERTVTVSDTAVLLALIATLPPAQQGVIWQTATRIAEQLATAQAQLGEGEAAMPRVALSRIVAPGIIETGGPKS